MNSLVSGFTFIKNGLTLGYPIKESILSISPLCKEVIINVGFEDIDCKKDDGTYEYLRDHFSSDKYIFLKSYWDPNISKQGIILSEQTNIALKKCQYQYCQYIQGDECVHENDLTAIEEGIKNLEEDSSLNGLVFKYCHFYGNVNAYLHTRRIYRREMRLIRNHQNIVSHLDAQGFRYQNGKKVLAKLIDATIYHYGWARKEKIMSKKIEAMDKLYHGKEHEQKNEFNYKKIWGLKKFEKTHPSIMKEWIKSNQNEIDIHKLKYEFNRKDISLMFCDLIEKYTNYRIGEYKGYLLK